MGTNIQPDLLPAKWVYSGTAENLPSRSSSHGRLRCQSTGTLPGEEAGETAGKGDLPGRGSELSASLGCSGRRRAVWGHTLNTRALTKTDEQRKTGFKQIYDFVLGCIHAILGHVQPTWELPSVLPVSF